MKLFSPAVNVEIISCTDDATFTHTTSVVRTLVFHARPPYVLVHEGYEGPVPTTVTFAPTGTDPGTIVVYTPTDAPEDEQTKKDGSQSLGFAQFCPAQLCSTELGPAQLCPTQLGSTQLSGTQLCSTELSATQLCATELGSTQLIQSSASPSSSAPAPTPDVSCNNRGLEYAIYDHSFFNSDFPAFSSLDVNYFHVTQPAFTGTTERVGIPPGTNPYFPPFSIYDDTPARLYMFTAVNHRAFLYAPVTGTYTITVPDSDEITLVWLGDKAISTWTRANADLEQDYNTVDGPEETTVFRIQLQAGTYTPFRLLWANAQGELSFIARVQAPDGRIIEDGDGSDSDYFVRFACDMSTPEYPPFGQDG
ncbi:putative cell agglutination protein pfl4 like [Verticillium longisporum]|nr:putative cell agglutination protein pfl4 like [Verticillium longisporum]